MSRLAVIVLCLFAVVPDREKDTLVRSVAEFDAAVLEAGPGDTITLANGIWPDADLVFDADGAAGDTITVRAETPGEVLLTGTSTLRIGGSYLKVEGLWFHRGALARGHVVAFRTNRPAHHSRFTQGAVTDYNPPNWLTQYKWVSLYGTHNRVDHSYLAGKTHDGATLVVWLENPPDHVPNYHRIDHNHFGPRPRLGKNGGETIRIGTSHRSMQDSRTVVEHNLFERTDGEHEIISNKTGLNVYRHNTFLEARGALTLRHGNGAVVTQNYFLGNGRTGTGGVRVIGEDHQVTHNYFADLRGDSSRAALSIMNGIPDSPLNRYFQVKRCLIAHNTFVGTSVTILYGLGADSEKLLPPEDVSFIGNAVRTESKRPILTALVPPDGASWKDNVFQGSAMGIALPEGVRWQDPDLAPIPDGRWTPGSSGAGASQEYAPLTARDVGPHWFGQSWMPHAVQDTTRQLPDFSYAGYHWGEDSLPRLTPTMSVTDYGATGDDSRDDTPAFQRALDAAHAAEGPVVLGIPAGRFHLSDILFVERGDFVIQGSGSTETVLVVEKPLGALEAPQDGRNNDGAPGQGRISSPFTDRGGIIWTRAVGDAQGREVAEVLRGASGGHRIHVEDASGIASRDVVRLEWSDAGADGQRRRQDLTITGADGATLLTKEPLRADISVASDASLTVPPRLTDIGFEHFRIAFEHVPYSGHYLEDGYNGLYLTGVRHGWVRDVQVAHADAAILVDASSQVTIQDFASIGRAGHYGVWLGDAEHVLVTDVSVTADMLHPISVGGASYHNVFTGGQTSHLQAASHTGNNLFDDLVLLRREARSRVLDHAGTAPLVLWNIRMRHEEPDAMRLPAYLGAVHGSAQIIGITANVPVTLDIGTDTYAEGINRSGIEIPSLYRYQLQQRLGLQGTNK